jgi:hypothetical protein
VGRGDEQDREPEVVESFGPMPFGWNTLVASVYDLEGLEHVSLMDEEGQEGVSVELADAGGFRPRLVQGGGGRKELAPDDYLVFWGQAPCLEIWKSLRQTDNEFLDFWAIEIRALDQTGSERGGIHVRLRDLTEAIAPQGSSLWRRIDLGCRALLGPKPWGEYQLLVRGPIGQDARFQFRVLPEVSVIRDRIDWSNISKTVKCQSLGCAALSPRRILRDIFFPLQGSLSGFA